MPGGKKFACATVCHTNAEATFVNGTLSAKIFGMCRNGELKIPAFPDFADAMKSIRQYQRAPQPTYEVCVALGDGSLIVRQSLVEFWSVKHSSFADALKDVVQKHNSEFNQKGLTRGSEEADGDGEQAEVSGASNNLCLGTSASQREFEAKYSERTAGILTSYCNQLI